MKLTPEQVAELEAELRIEDKRKYADRIRVILLLSRGWSPSKVAEALFLDPSTIHRYRASYQEGGLEQLIIDGYYGRRSMLSTAEKEELKLHIKSHPAQAAKEVATYIESYFGISYSVSGVTHLLHSLGFSYKKPKGTSAKANPVAQAEFVDKLDILRENIGDDATIFFADATHPEMNAHPQYGWFPRGERAEVDADPRRVRQNILGAVNVDNHASVFRSYERITSTSVISFLKTIESSQADLSKIYVIVDNARYFKSKVVNEFLKKEGRRVRLIYLPPYSPNLNPIERVWKFLHKKILNNKYYSSALEFKKAITNFIRKFRTYSREMSTLLSWNFENVAT